MSIVTPADRARAYAAVGDVSRLAIVDLLALGDLSAGDIGARLGLASNLLAHHLRVLHDAGLVTRRRSEGDRRRTYVSRTSACAELLGVPVAPGSERPARPARVAFVCSQNSARSQLAESCWKAVSDVPVVSAGLRPATRVHPGAVAAARRRGLDLRPARPKLAGDVLVGDEFVVTVCDRAHEELGASALHWSVPDPVGADSPLAFDEALIDIEHRVARLATDLEGHLS